MGAYVEEGFDGCAVVGPDGNSVEEQPVVLLVPHLLVDVAI